MTDSARRAVLIVSLALNIFLLAGIGAVAALGASASRPASQPVLRHAALSLNPDDRARFLALLRERGRIAKPANVRARMLRLDGWGSLGDAAFDPAAAKARLAQARQLNLDTRGDVENAVVEFAAALPQPERAALGQGLRATIMQNNNMPAPKN